MFTPTSIAARPSTKLIVAVALIAVVTGSCVAQPNPTSDKPNILVIWGDDIGTWNISHNNRGMMGYETPNIVLARSSSGIGGADFVRDSEHV